MYHYNLVHTTDESVIGIEDIYRPRTKDTSKGVIYFIKPSKESTQQIVDDFSNDSQSYGEAYVMVVSATPDHVLKKMRSSNAKMFIKAWKDLNYDYIGISVWVMT